MSDEKKKILDAQLLVVEFEDGGLSKNDKKALKAYDSAVKNALAVFGGNTLKPTTTIPNDSIGNVIKEMIEEDAEKLMGQFKERMRELLGEKVTMDKDIAQAKKDFNQAVIQKKIAFTRKVNEAMKLVDKIHTIQADYMKSLGKDAAPMPVADNLEEEEEE